MIVFNDELQILEGFNFDINKFKKFEDKIDVNARCQMPVTLFYILWDKMKLIIEQCPILSKKIDAIEMAFINKDNPIALDYIISRDSSILKNKKKRSRKE